VARAEAHGLQYLGESSRQPADPPPLLRDWIASRLDGEQCLDFVHNASFRRSLFCKQGVALTQPTAERIEAMHFNVLCQPVSLEPDVRGDKEETFRAEKGQLTTSIPLVKAILVALHRVWPRTLTLSELTQDVRVRLDAVDDPELTAELVAEGVLQCYGSNLVAIHQWAPRFAPTASEHPLASPLARLQAQAGVSEVFNLRHRTVTLNPFELALLARLDGTRDRAALLEDLIHDAEAGRFTIEKSGEILAGEALRAAISDSMTPTLGRLAHGALLVS